MEGPAALPFYMEQAVENSGSRASSVSRTAGMRSLGSQAFAPTLLHGLPCVHAAAVARSASAFASSGVRYFSA